MTELLLEIKDGPAKAALLRDGRLFRYEEEAGGPAAESLYLAKVDRCVPALEAAFVRIGPKETAYLPYTEMRGVRVPPRCGEKLLVQVRKAPVGQKQAYVTMDVSLAGRGAVYLPLSGRRAVSSSADDSAREALTALCERLAPGEGGLILRREALNMEEERLREEIASLEARWRGIVKNLPADIGPVAVRERVWQRFLRDARPAVDRVIADAPVPGLGNEIADKPFERYGVGEMLRRALRQVHHLPCGGNVTLEKTEALWAADVNSAKAVGQKKGLEMTALKTNIEAAEELARLCQVRNVGGILIIDFVDMTEEAHRGQVEDALRKAFEADPRKVTFHGFTVLGLYAITRKKDGDTLKAGSEDQ